MTKRQSKYQWYPGETRTSVYSTGVTRTFYFTTAPVRPKSKTNALSYHMSPKEQNKAQQEARIYLNIDIDRASRKITYYATDLDKSRMLMQLGDSDVALDAFIDSRYGPYTASIENESDEVLIEQLQEKALTKILSPMELMSLQLKSNPSFPGWTLIARNDVFSSWQYQQTYPTSQISASVRLRYRPNKQYIIQQFLAEKRENEDRVRLFDGLVLSGAKDISFSDPNSALSFCDNWLLNTFSSPMEVLAQTLNTNGFSRSNPEKRLLHWIETGGTSNINFYRAWYQNHNVAVGVEGRNRPIPHFIHSFVVVPDNAVKASHFGPVRQHKFTNEDEALAFAEEWFLENCLTPMQLMSESLTKSNPTPKHTWRIFTQPYKDINQWSAMIGDYRARVHVRRFDDHRYVIYRLDLQRKNHEDFRFKPADLETTYASEEETLAAAEDWIYNQLSPMEILSLTSTAKNNPSTELLDVEMDKDMSKNFRYILSNPFLLDFKYPTTVFGGYTHEAQHQRRTISLRLEPSWPSPTQKMYRLAIFRIVGPPPDYIYGHGPTGALFKTEEEAFEFVSAWYADKYLSPMELLSTSLKTNPRRRYVDVKGRSIPARYLKGLPKKLQEKRIKELGRSRDAYKRGDYSELPTDKAARKLGLVKQSAYSVVAEKRGIEWRGDAKDMARRVLKHYGVTASGADLEHMVEGIQRAYNKGLAAWKSGGHRPGATATNWAVARVASLVVGGKAAFTADKKEFSWFPAALQKKILSKQSAVLKELEKQGRKEDVSFLTQARKKM